MRRTLSCHLSSCTRFIQFCILFDKKMGRRKNFYAVAWSRHLAGPEIFMHWFDDIARGLLPFLTQSREQAQAWVTKCPAEFAGFRTLTEAEQYLKDWGFSGWRVRDESPSRTERLTSASPRHYAVSRGRNVGTFSTYEEAQSVYYLTSN